MLHRVKDLSPEQRLAIEGLLGRTVSENEAVSVRAVAPPVIIPSALTSDQRNTALEQLHRYFSDIDTRRKPVSEEDELAIITAAIRSVRPHFRPID